MSIEKFNLGLVRHLDEENLVTSNGRDGELLLGQEQKANKIAHEIYSEMLKSKQNSVLFVCSTKKRTIQTAELISYELKKINNTIKISKSNEPDLESLNEGEFKIPKEYNKGDYLDGLKIASDAFSDEVYKNLNNPGTSKFLYRYGDPLLLEDGTYKYPKLLNYFEKPGENYKELLLRIYRLVIITHQKILKFERNTKVIVLTHGQTAQILKDLNDVASRVKNENLIFKTGELAQLCWGEYSHRDVSSRVTGQVDFIDLDHISDSDLIAKIKNEIDYLEKIN
jgi:broad specificity phosphatase PhoE